MREVENEAAKIYQQTSSNKDIVSPEQVFAVLTELKFLYHQQKQPLLERLEGLEFSGKTQEVPHKLINIFYNPEQGKNKSDLDQQVGQIFTNLFRFYHLSRLPDKRKLQVNLIILMPGDSPLPQEKRQKFNSQFEFCLAYRSKKQMEVSIKDKKVTENFIIFTDDENRILEQYLVSFLN